MTRTRSRGAPRQSDLRRAVSTAYYAVFHSLCACVADELIGKSRSKRGSDAYRKLYRAVEHRGLAKRLLEMSPGTPSSIADAVKELQDQRNDADYNLRARFARADVESLIETANITLRLLDDIDAASRTALAAHLLSARR